MKIINFVILHFRIFGRTKDDAEGRLLGADMEDLDMSVEFSDYPKNSKTSINMTPI